MRLSGLPDTSAQMHPDGLKSRSGPPSSRAGEVDLPGPRPESHEVEGIRGKFPNATFRQAQGRLFHLGLARQAAMARMFPMFALVRDIPSLDPADRTICSITADEQGQRARQPARASTRVELSN